VGSLAVTQIFLFLFSATRCAMQMAIPMHLVRLFEVRSGGAVQNDRW
jgi:hypothetical protein